MIRSSILTQIRGCGRSCVAFPPGGLMERKEGRKNRGGYGETWNVTGDTFEEMNAVRSCPPILLWHWCIRTGEKLSPNFLSIHKDAEPKNSGPWCIIKVTKVEIRDMLPTPMIGKYIFMGNQMTFPRYSKLDSGQMCLGIKKKTFSTHEQTKNNR